MPGPMISLTLITRNEEDNLPHCLQSVADLVDEIIVVDSGSTDRTVEIAKDYGAVVVDFSWCDDFSAARNVSLDHATGQWIFWLDADDVFDAVHRKNLEHLIGQLDRKDVAYMMSQCNRLVEAPNERVLFDRVHLFPNLEGVRWEYRVHEQIMPSLASKGVRFLSTGIQFEHSGYFSEELHRSKAERNCKLGLLEVNERPTDGFVHFNLAWSLHKLRRFEEAVKHWHLASEYSNESESYLPKLFFLWSRDLDEMGNRKEALNVCLRGRYIFPKDPELLFLEALYRRESGEIKIAEQLFLELIDFERDNSISASFNDSIPGCKARCNLAEIYAAQGRDSEAENLWVKALENNGLYMPAWLGLGSLYRKNQNWHSLDKVINNVITLPGGRAVAGTLGQARAGSQPMSMQVPSMNNQSLQQAEFLFQQNRLDEAEELYKKMLSSNFLPGVMHYRLGMIANQRGDFETAIKEHREAFKVDSALAAKILPQGSPLQRWVYPGKFETTEVKECAVCGSKKSKTVNVVNCLPMNTFHGSIDPVRVWQECEGCGHAYPKERPADSVLEKIYSEPPPMHLQIWNYTQLALFSDILHEIKRIVPSGRFLDVGTAAGVLPGLAKDYGYDAVGMDIHPIYKENVERFGIDFIEGDFANHDFGKEKFDVVALGDVLEHMIDVKKAIKTLSSIINKNGVVWISTPNHDSAWSRGVGVNDPMWQESEHIQYFSRNSLTKLLQDHGFKVTDYRVSKRYQGSVELMVTKS